MKTFNTESMKTSNTESMKIRRMKIRSMKISNIKGGMKTFGSESGCKLLK